MNPADGADYLTIEDLRKEEPDTLRKVEESPYSTFVEVYRERWLHDANGRVSEYVGFTSREVWNEWVSEIGNDEFYTPTIPDSESE